MLNKKWTYVAGIILFFLSCGREIYHAGLTHAGLADSEKTFGYDETCSTNEADPFELKIRLNKPDFPCLDHDRRRPLVDLNRDSEATNRWDKVPEGYRRVANFHHNNSFYIADIPLNAEKQMEFQLSWFEAPLDLPAAHAQMLVRFPDNQPVLLYDQTAAPRRRFPFSRPKAAHTVREIVLSAEGAGESGVSCNLLGGQFGRFAIVYGVTSAAQRYDEILRFNKKQELDSFTLNDIGQKKMSEFLNGYLEKSFDNFHALQAIVDENELDVIADPNERQRALKNLRSRMFERATYRTSHRNCSTALAELVDSSRMKSFSGLLSRAAESLSFYPPAAAFLLYSQHIIDVQRSESLDLQAALQKTRSLNR